MNSREKLRHYFDAAGRSSDTDLQEALPFGIPSGMIRMALGFAEEQLPTDPAELDELIERGTEFLQSLRSDPVEAG